MSARPYDILVIGELNVDIVVCGNVLPRYGQVEQLVEDIVVCAGSSAGIFAASAAKMGMRVLFASIVGDDLFGHFMLDALREAGVDTTHVVVDPMQRTGSGIMLSHGLDRAILTFLGTIGAVSAELVDPGWYAQARHLHVVSPFLLKRLRPDMPAIMRAAKQAGMTVSLDTDWDPDEAWAVDDLLAPVDVFLPNENELRAITGAPDLRTAVEIMAARVPVVAVKRGPEGALAARRSERAKAPAYPVEVVDTTGAGDTFDGGFLAGWLRGEPLGTCVSLGCVCGSFGTTQVGGFNGQPTWDQAMAVVRSWRPS